MPDSQSTDADLLLERLAALESGQISDVLDEAGLPNQVLSTLLAPLAPGQRICGRAACARGAPVISVRNKSVQAGGLEDAVFPGSILVIETGGFVAGACVGGFVAYDLQRLGCLGVVTDGAVRDVEEIVGFGFPCFAAARSPAAGGRRWRVNQTGAPISLPGQDGVRVRIAPGDLVLGDADGIVVVPTAHAQQIIEDAETLKDIERKIGEELRAGGSRADVFKRNPRFDHIRTL